MKKFLNCTLFIATLCLPHVSMADFRCPTTGKIVSEGMTQYEVTANCGDPAFKAPLQNAGVAMRTESKVNDEKSTSTAVVVNPGVPVEEWTYDFGPNKLVQLLRFKNGRLTNIEARGYGTKPP